VLVSEGDNGQPDHESEVMSYGGFYIIGSWRLFAGPRLKRSEILTDHLSHCVTLSHFEPIALRLFTAIGSVYRPKIGEELTKSLAGSIKAAGLWDDTIDKLPFQVLQNQPLNLVKFAALRIPQFDSWCVMVNVSRDLYRFHFDVCQICHPRSSVAGGVGNFVVLVSAQIEYPSSRTPHR
jgi:hypothetical protein